MGSTITGVLDACCSILCQIPDWASCSDMLIADWSGSSLLNFSTGTLRMLPLANVMATFPELALDVRQPYMNEIKSLEN